MNRTEQLREIIARAKTLPLYRERLTGVDPDDVTADDVSALPFLEREDLTRQFDAEPTGGFLQHDVVQMHLTPAPGLGRMPEFLTRRDLHRQASAIAHHLARCDIGPGDRCLVAFSYHALAGGWLFHEGLVERGCTVLAHGPGDAESVVEVAEAYGFRVLVSNPSFAKRIGEAGGRFDKLVAAGEPFTAVPGYREEVESALGCRAFDAYGLSETGVVAAETAERDGLHALDEAAILEVIDPQTRQPVANGEKGELVVTSLTREAMPILRFRTGDLTLRGERGGRLLLPRGVFGRTDTMVKVKGVKLYPKELLFLLAGTEGVEFRNYQVVVERDDRGTDRATLRVQRTQGATIDVESLADRVRKATGIRMNEIRVEDVVDGDVVDDRRF